MLQVFEKKLKCFFSNQMNTVPLTRNNQSYTMSSSSRNTASSSAPVKGAPRPYCKVCHDAGRPEKEYTSHYVKDQPGPQGKVICPTLLNQSCRICNKTGHTSSYCSQYRRREEPRREERYIEREPRRDYRDDDRRREEPRREESRREERYIEREPRRDYRDDDRRREDRNSFNRLREDTERHEREICSRDEKYCREQERLAKPWLQAALKPAAEPQRRDPYAHPHGPRVRLVIEAPALSASRHAAAEEVVVPTAAAAPAAAIDIRNVTLNHASKWGDEDNEEPFVYDPEKMSREFLQQCIMSGLTTSEEHEFIAACDNQSEMPFFCGQ
jgi:hypothetical protein